MLVKEDNNEGAKSNVLCETYRPPMSPASSQPFVFQQYTVRETVTPTKLGNLSMREVTFSMCSEESGATASAFNVSFSPRATPKRQQKCKYLPMLVRNLLSTSTHVEDISANIAGPVAKPHFLKRLNRNTHAFKKVKVDSDNDLTKPRRHSKHTTNRICNKQIKESKELHQKYIFLISLLPLFLVLFLIRYFGPTNVNNILLDSLTDPTDTMEQDILLSNLEPLRYNLKQQVFGQEFPVSSLLHILDSFINKDMLRDKQMPVVLLSGSSGVGKSLILSIVTNNYPAPGRTKLIQWPAPTPELALKKFSESHLNLVVIDSLNLNSLTHAVNWTKKLFNEALWQNKPVMVILSLTVQVQNVDLVNADDSAPQRLKEEADRVYKTLFPFGFDPHHIHLNVLTAENVKDCIRVALMKRGTNGPLSEKHVTLVSEHINFKLEGCKSVWNYSLSVA